MSLLSPPPKTITQQQKQTTKKKKKKKTKITLSSGQPFVEAGAWEDIYASILGARKLIYITGWSVWTETVLTRRPASDADAPTLGELLKARAEEGVDVLMLVW